MPVQTKTTLSIIALCMIISASMMLSSCSTTNSLTSQNPHYHLNLVKADNTAKVDKPKDKVGSVSAIAPVSQHGSLVSYQSGEQLKALTDLLKSDVKQIEKQEKKTNPVIYKNLKKININKVVNQCAQGKAHERRRRHCPSRGEWPDQALRRPRRGRGQSASA